MAKKRKNRQYENEFKQARKLLEYDLIDEVEFSDTVDLPENFETYDPEKNAFQPPSDEQQDVGNKAAHKGVYGSPSTPNPVLQNQEPQNFNSEESIGPSSILSNPGFAEQLLTDPRLATQFQVDQIQKQNNSYALMAVCLNGLLEAIQQQNIILSDLSKQLGNIEQVGILLVQLGQVFAGTRDA